MLSAAYPLWMTCRAIANTRRARGVLLALVLGLSQASAWLHAAAISHTTCLEHGESIHAVGDAHALADGVAANADSVDGSESTAEITDADRAAPDTGVAAAHDHCASSALLRWRDIALAAPVAAVLPPAVQQPTFHAPPSDTAAGVVVYLVAPKTSPPYADA
jgi:hypothetical protein